MNEAETLSELLINHGGPIVLAMVAASVVIMTVALERLLQVMRMRLALRRADSGVLEAARRGDLDEARRLAEKVGYPVRDVFVAGLDRHLGRVRGKAPQAMAREQKRAVAEMRGMVWILGSAGALLPFVGLFGTVVGVMRSFQSIGASGQGGFAVVSSGIAEALVATAVGLAVALEAMVFYNWLQNTINRMGTELALLVDELGELLSVAPTVPGGADDGQRQ